MNQEPQAMAALATAVNAVMSEVGYVKKGGNVKFGTTSYSFAGEKHIIQALRPAMVEHGLMLIPVSAESVRSERGCETVRCTYRLMHTGGAWLDVQVLGQGADKGDKAIPKALTGALKYALRQTFTIETGDDPGRDASGKTAQEIEEAEKKRAEQARREALGIDDKGHALWFRTSGRAWTCAQLSNAGTSYDAVAAWCESIGKGRPSGWPEDRVRTMVASLITPDSKARKTLDAWVAKQAKEAA